MSLLSTLAIYLYYSRGLGEIGEPVLASLAAKSTWWIPVYRMASPSLILFMPKSCAKVFGAFFLLAGMFCCINDFGLILAGRPLVVEAIGMYPSLAACFLASFAVLVIEVLRSRNRLKFAGHTLAWLATILCVHAVFCAAGIAA